MDGTSKGHLLDEKDARTTGEYSAPSGRSTRSEKYSLDENTTATRGNTISSRNSLTGTTMPSPGETASGGGVKTMSATGPPPAAETGDHRDPTTPILPAWRFALLGFGLCLGLFLAMLDTSIVATCMFSIALEFQSLDSINWVALSYTLTYLGCAVIFARISDVIGRKAAFLVAYGIFISFSLACGFAQSLNQLIVFRALQGLGGGGLYSIAIIIFPELTPDDKKKFIAGIIGIVIAVAGVMGPVVGGLLTHYRSWRYVFWINGPIGGVSAIVFWLTWPKTEFLPDLKRRSWKDLDYLGSFLLIAASVLIVFSFQNAGVDAQQWSQAVFIAPLILGIFSLFSLLAWEYFIERRWHGEKAAAFPLCLLRNHVYTAGILNTMFTGFPYFICIYTFPIRFQVVNGKSALEAGLMLLPMLVGTAVGSSLSGVISAKNNRIFETLVAACSLMIMGVALETTASDSRDIEPKVLGFLAFIGFGFGLAASSSTMLASLESPIREHAPAQGILAQARILGGSLGIAASSAILGVKSRAELTGVLSPAQMQDLASAASTLTAEQHAAVRRTYTDALKVEMIVCSAVLAVGFLLTFGVYRKNRVTIDEQQQERYREEGQHRRKREGPAVEMDAGPGSA